ALQPRPVPPPRRPPGEGGTILPAVPPGGPEPRGVPARPDGAAPVGRPPPRGGRAARRLAGARAETARGAGRGRLAPAPGRETGGGEGALPAGAGPRPPERARPDRAGHPERGAEQARVRPGPVRARPAPRAESARAGGAREPAARPGGGAGAAGLTQGVRKWFP